MGVQILPPERGVNGEGLAIAVEGLEATLRGMLGRDAQLPRVLFTDRGTTMYAPSGHVVHAYSDAVSKAGFRLYWGADARRQSPDMGDLLLHETAVSWFRSTWWFLGQRLVRNGRRVQPRACARSTPNTMSLAWAASSLHVCSSAKITGASGYVNDLLSSHSRM